MALLKRELHRQVKGPEITHADHCTLVFDTDTKRLYVESEVAHFEAKIGGTVEYQTTTMDIADYLTQGGQTAGHRELWRLLRSLFNENSDSAEYVAPDTIELSRELILSVFGPSPKRRRLRLSALGNSQAILLLPSWQHPRLKIGF